MTRHLPTIVYTLGEAAVVVAALLFDPRLALAAFGTVLMLEAREAAR